MITFRKDKKLSDSRVVVVETDSVVLHEILEDFKGFLMACGYSINSTDKLEIFTVEEE